MEQTAGRALNPDTPKLASFEERMLRDALSSGKIVAYYQPKFDLASGEFAGVEALARWQHPQLGLLTPGDFVPNLMRLQMSGELTAAMARNAAASIARWMQSGRSVKVGINAAWPCVEDGRLIRTLEEVMSEFDISPKQMEVELTEYSKLRCTATALLGVHRLRKLGISVAIDDFGVENSTFGLLRDVCCDVVKLDRSFVNGIASHPRFAAIVGGIIATCNALGMQVVAEGVDNEADYLTLAELKCHQVQGFLFGRPMPEQELLSYLDSIDSRLAMTKATSA